MVANRWRARISRCIMDTDGSTMSASHKTARADPFVRGFTNSPWTAMRFVLDGSLCTLPEKNVRGSEMRKEERPSQEAPPLPLTLRLFSEWRWCRRWGGRNKGGVVSGVFNLESSGV